MSRINQVPFGLQFLLGNANFGDNPSELNDVTAPTLDQFPFLSTTLIDYERNSALLTTRGEKVDLIVPEGQAWMPINMSFRVAGYNAVGTLWTGRFLLNKLPRKNPLTPGSSHVLFESRLFTSIGVGDGDGLSYDFPQNYLLGSSTEISGQLTSYIPGGAPLEDSFTLDLQYYRFLV